MEHPPTHAFPLSYPFIQDAFNRKQYLDTMNKIQYQGTPNAPLRTFIPGRETRLLAAGRDYDYYFNKQRCSKLAPSSWLRPLVEGHYCILVRYEG